MNLISQYEQGYISYSEFEQEFPDSISESQECVFGTRCVEHYVNLTLGKTDYSYYIQRYGGDIYEDQNEVYYNSEIKREISGNPFI